MPAKGTSKYGADVVVGSPEYWRRHRAANKDRNKLAQDRYKAKQRLAYLATKLAVDEGIPINQALEEVGVELQNIQAVRRKLEIEGRITKDGSIVDNLNLPAEEEVPFIRNMADKHGVSYEEAFAVMNDDSITDWEAEFTRRKEAAKPSLEGSEKLP